jgi:hypothetical protein
MLAHHEAHFSMREGVGEGEGVRVRIEISAVHDNTVVSVLPGLIRWNQDIISI